MPKAGDQQQPLFYFSFPFCTLRESTSTALTEGIQILVAWKISILAIWYHDYVTTQLCALSVSNTLVAGNPNFLNLLCTAAPCLQSNSSKGWSGPRLYITSCIFTLQLTLPGLNDLIVPSAFKLLTQEHTTFLPARTRAAHNWKIRDRKRAEE